MDRYEEALERAKKGLPIDEVFPELKESEDEKIRKELLEEIEFIIPHDDETDSEGLILPSYHARIDRYKPYLEKQKEQKPAEDWREKRKEECPFRRNLDNNLYGCERYADVISACTGACSWVVDYPKLKEIQDKKEQKPNIEICPHSIKSKSYSMQKPTEWKPQPESLEALMYAIEGKWEAIKPTSYLSRRLEDLYDGLVNTFNVDESFIAHENDYVSKSAEWSEEDERTLESFLGWLQGSMGEKTYSSWLKSLPERFRPQPKQEWSEEDEEMLNSCISSIEEAKENRYAYKETDGDTSYDHEIAWLKSLRNRVGKEFLQPHWKPSEEQMEALKDAFRKDGCNEYRKVINSLYCDLQKLL